jgi:membrane-associated protease RseP (regulator of RpoE activity)
MVPRYLSALTALVGLLLAPSAGEAQNVVVGEERGWIGISVEVQTAVNGLQTFTMVTVTDVHPGGPANNAGIRPGDRLVSVGGQAWERFFSGGTSALRPGEPLRVVVERGGVKRELELTAARRPAALPNPPHWTVTVRADSIVDRMYRAMDSLRVRLIEEAESGLTVVQASGRGRGRLTVVERAPESTVRVRRADEVHAAPERYGFPAREQAGELGSPPNRPPFVFSLFRDEEYDSLRTEMESLDREAFELRRRAGTRMQELADALPAGERRIDGTDPELRRLDAMMEELGARGAVLRAAMAKAVREGAQEPQEFSFSWSTGPEDVIAVEPGVSSLRPLAPYLLGESRAAGAEVVDLRPELAEYFQVDGGVLVVDVPQGTPAHMAGIHPGDVITHVGDAVVRSIPDLRQGLGRAAPELSITLVRKGTHLQVLLVR